VGYSRRRGRPARLARLLLTSRRPRGNRRGTTPGGASRREPVGSCSVTLLSWPIVLAHCPGPLSWPTVLAHCPGPLSCPLSWPCFSWPGRWALGRWPAAPTIPMRSARLQSAKIGTPGRACLPMGPILLHKTGHCRSDGCSRRGRGCSSGVEHHVANVRVVGSNPIARSNVEFVRTFNVRTVSGRLIAVRTRRYLPHQEI
jgi:hypothetical protein